jgi:toxin-antitoxin system PIN domain toxin
VIAVDTNILVYAHREELSQHKAALGQLRQLAEDQAQWALPVFCLGEFVRIVTHPRVFSPPSSLDEAVAALRALAESPSLVLLLPGDRYWPLLQEAALEANATGNLAFDAQIVALCREHGVRALLTEDRDFARFRRFPVQRLGE